MKTGHRVERAWATRQALGGQVAFAAPGPALQPKDVLSLSLDWEAPATAQVSLDRGGDGSIDETLTLVNSLSAWRLFLPLTRR